MVVNHQHISPSGRLEPLQHGANGGGFIARGDDDEHIFAWVGGAAGGGGQCVLRGHLTLAGSDSEVRLQCPLSGLAQLLAQGWLVLQVSDGIFPAGRVLWRRVQTSPRLFYHPRHARARQLRDDARAAMGHGFEQYHAKGFGALARGQAEHVTAVQQHVFFGIAHAAEQAHGGCLSGGRGVVYQRLQWGAQFAVADDQQLHAGHIGHGFDQCFEAFVIGEPTDRQQAQGAGAPRAGAWGGCRSVW